MADDVPLEALALTKMSSGDFSLELTDAIPWESFGPYAEALIGRLGGQVVSRGDSPVERIWVVEVDGHRYWLSHDSHAPAVSLDSQDPAGSAQLPAIAAKLGLSGERGSDGSASRLRGAVALMVLTWLAFRASDLIDVSIGPPLRLAGIAIALLLAFSPPFLALSAVLRGTQRGQRKVAFSATFILLAWVLLWLTLIYA